MDRKLGGLGILIGMALTTASASAQSPIFECADQSGTKSYYTKREDGMSCSIIGATHDDRWAHVATGVNGDLVRVDKETIVRDEGAVIAWTMYLHLKSGNYISGKGYAFKVLQRERYECNEMKFGVVSYAAYSENDHPLETGTYLSAVMTPIVPNTIQEVVWRWLCRP